MATIIKASHVNKAFKLPHEKHGSIKSLFVNIFRKRRGYELQQVLHDISFDIAEGDFFGIVGRNGSGKSTLLKLIAGIYTPDTGGIEVGGKLTPFIELGVGFNPELSGRDNIYLNGALLGFNRKEVDAMYDDIVAFAELERFMDQKLKNYSSGMQVRLAFSIAIQAQSDILLLDEVLAVGDAAFQQKCFDYFEELKKQKKTVVFVTHDMSAVKRFCSRALMIKEGKITLIDTPQRIAMEYAIENSPDTSANAKPGSTGKKDVAIEDIVLTANDSNKPTNKFSANDKITVTIKYNAKKPRKVFAALSFTKADGHYLAGISTKGDFGKLNTKKGRHEIVCRLPASQFSEAAYYLNVALADYDNGGLIDYVDYSVGMDAPKVYILESADNKDGEFVLNGDWQKQA